MARWLPFFHSTTSVWITGCSCVPTFLTIINWLSTNVKNIPPGHAVREMFHIISTVSQADFQWSYHSFNKWRNFMYGNNIIVHDVAHFGIEWGLSLFWFRRCESKNRWIRFSWISYLILRSFIMQTAWMNAKSTCSTHGTRRIQQVEVIKNKPVCEKCINTAQ